MNTNGTCNAPVLAGDSTAVGVTAIGMFHATDYQSQLEGF